jgi:hypothetical protein
MADEDYTAGTYSKLAEAVEKKHQPPTTETVPEERIQNVPKATKTPSNRDTTIPRYQDTKYDTDFIEVVRKAVKQLGKEAATYRFTQKEKGALADIVYSLKTKGTRSSENEITRIAINYLVWEYHHSKQSSILARVLERLNA